MSSPAKASRRRAPESVADRARRRALRALKPPPNIPLPDWLDEHFRPGPGERWKTLPFQRGIAEAMADPEVEELVLLKSSRVGFTKLLVGYNCYRIALDPCRILVAQASDEEARDFSKEDLAPAIEETAAIRGLVAEPRARDESSTTLRKTYPGGWMRITGAHSGRGFRRLTADVVELDEVDAYPPSAGGEGDQIKLGRQRLKTVAFPKLIIGSSPRHAVTSKVMPEWERSDQRDYVIPCPHCDHGQRLRWGGRDTDFGIKWPDDDPSKAFYLCEHCHCEIQEHHKLWMLEQGLEHQDQGGGWVPGKPGAPVVGFRIWAAYSTFPQASWGKLASEWTAIENPIDRQVFVNTVLGEPWDGPSHSLDGEKIQERREVYPVRATGRTTPEGEPETERLVPKRAAILTAGVDTHDDRIEVQVAGYGAREECWKLEYHVLWGDPSTQALWDDLDDLLLRPRPLERGGVDYIRATAIDTQGHHGARVAAFCRTRLRRKLPNGMRAYVFAIAGVGGPGLVWPREASKSKHRVQLWRVHVDPVKELLHRRLTRETTADGEPEVMIHFPRAFEFSERYFQQLESEKMVPSYDRRGFPRVEWVLRSPGRRNEAWDTAVYDYVALRGLIDGMGLDFERVCRQLERRLEKLGLADDDASGAAPPAAPALPAQDPGQPAPQPKAQSKPRRRRRPKRQWRPARI